MANLQNWAEGGPEALTTPTIGTGLNPVNLSTPGSASQEHQRREEERTKRGADEEESDSSSSEEEEEETPISLDLNEEEYGGSNTPSDLVDRKCLPTKSTGRLSSRRLGRSPPGPSARQLNRRSRVVVVVRHIKGGEVRSA